MFMSQSTEVGLEVVMQQMWAVSYFTVKTWKVNHEHASLIGLKGMSILEH